MGIFGSMKEVMKKALIFFLFIAPYSVFSQGFSDYYFVLWSDHRRLNWNDFVGVVRPYSHYTAVTSSRIYTDDFYHSSDTIKIKMVSVFDKFVSWTKIKDTSAGKYELKHEQDHFDITEIYARKIRRALCQVNNMTTYGPVDSITEIYNAELDKEEDKYDIETNNSIDEDEQKKWNVKVEKELDELDAYKDNVFVIKLQENRINK